MKRSSGRDKAGDQHQPPHQYPQRDEEVNKVIAIETTGRCEKLPKRIKRPADYGLQHACINLETQYGTIEAYNRLVEAAKRMKAQIDAGKAKPQNPLFAISVSGNPAPTGEEI